MLAWIDVAPADALPAGGVRTIDAGGKPVAVFNVGGRYYAIEDVCSHEEETLSEGDVDGTEIVCPRHAARFSLVTGEALCAPAYEPVSIFPVRIEGGMIQVGVEREVS